MVCDRLETMTAQSLRGPGTRRDSIPTRWRKRQGLQICNIAEDSAGETGALGWLVKQSRCYQIERGNDTDGK